MVFIGVDLHRKSSQVAVLDNSGTVLSNRKVPTASDELLRIFGEWEPADLRLGLVRRPPGRRGHPGPPGASAGHQGTGRWPGEERQGRRSDPGPPAAHRPLTRGLDRSTRGAGGQAPGSDASRPGPDPDTPEVPGSRGAGRAWHPLADGGPVRAGRPAPALHAQAADHLSGLAAGLPSDHRGAGRSGRGRRPGNRAALQEG